MIGGAAVPLVAQVMTADPITIRADAPIADAARLIDEARVSGLPVVDRAGSLVGVITETDLLRARATEHIWAHWARLKVWHLMTAPAIVVRVGTPVTLAAARMQRAGVHRVVVVADDDEALPIGVVSISDIVHLIAHPGWAGQRDGTAEPGPEADADPPSPDRPGDPDD